MKYLVLILYIHLFLSYTVGVSYGFTDWLRSISSYSKHKRSKRGLYQFKGIINCLQPWVDILQTYADYGCYCGFLGEGRPLDDTDKCCYLHDQCYNGGESVEKTFGESMSGMYLTSYKFDCEEGKKITCRSDLNTPYQQHFCECDRLAAECFLYSRRSYNEKLFNINTSEYCEKNSDLRALSLGTHTLGKLYSCDMKMQDDKCCLDKGYNSVYETCCNNEIRSLIPGAICCGEQYKVMNDSVSCCDGQYYDITTHGCCHRDVYDVAKYECVHDDLHDLHIRFDNTK